MTMFVNVFWIGDKVKGNTMFPFYYYMVSQWISNKIMQLFDIKRQLNAISVLKT